VFEQRGRKRNTVRHTCADRKWSLPKLPYNAYRHFLGLMRTVNDTELRRPSSLVVKNEWRCTSAYPLGLYCISAGGH